MKYTKGHQWVRVSGDIAEIGITDYAQEQLGEVVYVGLPDVGEEFERGKIVFSVESGKVMSEVEMPVSGEITEVNEELDDRPELLNADPFGTFVVKVKISSPEEVDDLLDASEYKELCN